MIILEYIDEDTFIAEDVEFDDEHYEFAKKIHKQYENDLLSKCSPLMVRSDKQSLIFIVNLGDKLKDRTAYERGDNMYKVIIEKL